MDQIKLEISQLPDDRVKYYLNIFNVNTKAEISDIRNAFANSNILRINAVGATKKIYDLEFSCKKELLDAAESAALTILGQPFYIRTSLKNTTHNRFEKDDRFNRNYADRYDKIKANDFKYDNTYYADKNNDWGKKKKYHDRTDEYTYAENDRYATYEQNKYNEPKQKQHYITYEDGYKPENYSRHKYDKSNIKGQYRKEYKDSKMEVQAQKHATSVYDNKSSIKSHKKKDNNNDYILRTPEVQKYTKVETDERNYGDRGGKRSNAKCNKNQKMQAYKEQPKENPPKLTILDPQVILNQQRITKGQAKCSYATPNIFELLDTSD